MPPFSLTFFPCLVLNRMSLYISGGLKLTSFCLLRAGNTDVCHHASYSELAGFSYLGTFIISAVENEELSYRTTSNTLSTFLPNPHSVVLGEI